MPPDARKPQGGFFGGLGGPAPQIGPQSGPWALRRPGFGLSLAAWASTGRNSLVHGKGGRRPQGGRAKPSGGSGGSRPRWVSAPWAREGGSPYRLGAVARGATRPRAFNGLVERRLVRLGGRGEAKPPGGCGGAKPARQGGGLGEPNLMYLWKRRERGAKFKRLSPSCFHKHGPL